MANRDGSDTLLTLTETANRLATTDRHVRRLVSERRIAYVKVGGKLRFSARDIEGFIEAARVEAAPW